MIRMVFSIQDREVLNREPYVVVSEPAGFLCARKIR